MVGDFTIINLIAAGTNAFNGALLARQPSHYRRYTIGGIILIAIATGIAGGVFRDVILNTVPSAFENPAFIILSVLAGIAALLLHYYAGEKLQHGTLQFMTAFSLPWYATMGAQKALAADLDFFPAIVIGIIGATAGRFAMDMIAGVTPLQFVKSEYFVGAAVLSASVYVFCAQVLDLSIWPATLIAVAFGFIFRLAAVHWHWQEHEPRPPRNVPEGGEPEAVPGQPVSTETP